MQSATLRATHRGRDLLKHVIDVSEFHCEDKALTKTSFFVAACKGGVRSRTITATVSGFRIVAETLSSSKAFAARPAAWSIWTPCSPSTVNYNLLTVSLPGFYLDDFIEL